MSRRFRDVNKHIYSVRRGEAPEFLVAQWLGHCWGSGFNLLGLRSHKRSETKRNASVLLRDAGSVASWHQGWAAAGWERDTEAMGRAKILRGQGSPMAERLSMGSQGLGEWGGGECTWCWSAGRRDGARNLRGGLGGGDGVGEWGECWDPSWAEPAAASGERRSVKPKSNFCTWRCLLLSTH